MSLQLQLNNHCRQQRIVKEKWKNFAIEQKKEKQKQEQARLLQELQNRKKTKQELPLKASSKNSLDLVDGKKGTECSESSSLVISAENFSVSSTSSVSDCAASKDEKLSIQDLNGQVSDLQMQVLSLSQNLEDSNRENSRLKKALENVREFVRCKFGYELEGDLFDLKSPHISELQEFTSSDIKMVKSGIQASLHEDINVENVQDETGSDSDIDEDIPLPPLEPPQFIL